MNKFVKLSKIFYFISVAGPSSDQRPLDFVEYPAVLQFDFSYFSSGFGFSRSPLVTKLCVVFDLIDAIFVDLPDLRLRVDVLWGLRLGSVLDVG